MRLRSGNATCPAASTRKNGSREILLPFHLLRCAPALSSVLEPLLTICGTRYPRSLKFEIQIDTPIVYPTHLNAGEVQDP